jgi:serine/threonine protein kinase
MIGRTLSHHRITAAIGAGEMGEVYRATDTKLGREVAALDHPEIVTVHFVEEADDVHFLTMQLVEGHPVQPDVGWPAEVRGGGTRG